MRSHEERVAETKRRIAKIEREKRLRRNVITMASDDDVSQGSAAVKDAGRRFKAGIITGLDVCGNAGHSEGCADEQCKARRHSGSHGDRIAPQPLLPLNFGDAPLRLRNALLMTPHL